MLVLVIITSTAKSKCLMGYLVIAYYVAYILLDLDYFGVAMGVIELYIDESVSWHLIYTQLIFLFFVLSVLLGMQTNDKTPFFYAAWLIVNMATSLLSAVFQTFETNIFLFVYNLVQNLNIFVDILVVLVGTDNRFRGTYVVSKGIDYINFHFSNWQRVVTKNSNRIKSWNKKDKTN